MIIDIATSDCAALKAPYGAPRSTRVIETDRSSDLRVRAKPITPAEIREDLFQPDAPRGVSHTSRWAQKDGIRPDFQMRCESRI